MMDAPAQQPVQQRLQPPYQLQPSLQPLLLQSSQKARPAARQLALP